MNEQILEYAEQARLYAKSVFPHSIDDPTGWNYEYHKKFAELIVKECIRIPYDMWDKAELNADIAVKIEHRIRDHFGVEE